MAPNLLAQLKTLEEKIRTAAAVARDLRSERDRLAGELDQARKAALDSADRNSRHDQELAGLRAELAAVGEERDGLVKERDEVRGRVDDMLATIAQIEEAVGATK